MAKASKAKPHLHVNNDGKEAEVYHVTPARLEAAARKHKGLLGKLEISFSATPQDMDAALPRADILLASHFDAQHLARRAPNLKWLQVTSAGVEKLAPLVPAGVVLTNASGVHGPKGGEYAMTALLMLNHRVPRFATAKERIKWDQAFTTPVAGKTVVILGVGSIGGELARLAKRFGMRVIGVSRNGLPNRYVDDMVTRAGLKRVLPKADFLVGTLPLTPETRGLIGRAEFDLLPRHAGVANFGRSRVMDYEVLREKLVKRELSGAVLDVFDQEPLPPESPWWTTPNAILSPHCAIDDSTSYVPRCLDIFFDNLGRWLAGRKLRNVVDLALGY